MTLELNTPGEIYQIINDELARIVESLNSHSYDAELNQAQDVARTQFAQFQTVPPAHLTDLEKNAEWNTFTIAFYGETGVGKSTLIETLRILLQEPTKLASQQRFRELKDEYALSEDTLRGLQQAIRQNEAQIDELTQQLIAIRQQYEQPHRDTLALIDQTNARFAAQEKQLSTTLQQHEQQHAETLNIIIKLQAFIVEYKKTASLWQKLLNLFKKISEEVELASAKHQLTDIALARDSAATALRAQQSEAEQNMLTLARQLSEVETARDNASDMLLNRQAEAEQHKKVFQQQCQECEKRLEEILAELGRQADGEIIGDGRADFTRQTHRYDFTLNGETFALLDLPGIEGKENSVLKEIEKAVQTAHAVFYITNQPAPPQTGDKQRQGTLEKIKEHLGAQTEVWTVFNKKITNPKQSLKDHPLIKDDEEASMVGLDEKMREQFGEHYREVFPLTAMPAFLVSTEHFAPRSLNAKRRSKILTDFDTDELLEKSCLRAFVQLLNDKLLSGSKAKITRANFNKAKEAVDQTIKTLERTQRDFAKLAGNLVLDGQSAIAQLTGSFKALNQRFELRGEKLIDEFASKVRNETYARIEDNISNDVFEEVLKSRIDAQQSRLVTELPKSMSKEVERFQEDAEDILKRFEEQARELTEIYAKLSDTQSNSKFDLKLDLDNGLKVTNLLAVLAGGALLSWNPIGWFVIAMGVCGIAINTYKAVCCYFSLDYKKSQQRKAIDDNLRDIKKKLRDSLRDKLKSAQPEMHEKVSQLEQAIEAPGKQANAKVQLLDTSTKKLKELSREINNAGNL